MEPTEDVLRGLLAAAPDALIAVDESGCIAFANDQAVQLFGWTQAELLGSTVERLVPRRFVARHPRLRSGYASRPSTRPMGAGLELWALRRDGTEFPAEISLSSFETTQGTLVAAAIRDVADRLELEEERRRQALAAQQEQSHRLASLGQLAGGVAHDFNNLLGVILNYVALLTAETTDPRVRSDLGEIRAAADRAAGLTKQLLTFARRDVVHPEALDVNQVVRDLASMLDRTLGEHIDLRLNVPAASLAAIADRHQLEQVVLNLVFNARDAMPTGGDLRIGTTVATGADGGRVVRMSVSDSGHGMAPDVVARAFEPFYTTKPVGAGTGLGLATAYGIVQQHGGTIAIRSVEGRGTTVEIDLPLARDAVIVQPPVDAGPDGEGEVVLVVEDEAALRVGTARILEARGFRARTAAGAQEALAILEEEGAGIRVVLSDVAMPGMRGDELATRIAERWPAIPVILVSGHDAGRFGDATRVLAKPLAEDELLRAVRQAVDG